MVDGVLASCYASFHHDLAHITMTPIVWFPKIMEGIFGDENGFQGYVQMADDLGHRVLPKKQYYENMIYFPSKNLLN